MSESGLYGVSLKLNFLDWWINRQMWRSTNNPANVSTILLNCCNITWNKYLIVIQGLFFHTDQHWLLDPLENLFPHFPSLQGQFEQCLRVCVSVCVCVYGEGLIASLKLDPWVIILIRIWGLGCGQGNVQPDSVSIWTAIIIHGPAFVIQSLETGPDSRVCITERTWPPPKYY